MVWFLVESAVVVLAAAAVGFMLARVLARRSRPTEVGAPAPPSPDDALMAQLSDCRARASQMVDDMALMRSDLATRYAEIVRLADDRDDALAAQSRTQVDLANRTAELIVRGEEFARFRAAVRDRYGDEPDIPPAPPAPRDAEVEHRVS